MNIKCLLGCFAAGLIRTGVAGASVILAAPPGGPVTLHQGIYPIDLNEDGSTDITLGDGPAYGPGTNEIGGSFSSVTQAFGVGTYRGGAIMDNAVAMDSGQQVGTITDPGDNFVYTDLGLGGSAIIHMYGGPTSDTGGPAWTDGLHHFIGVDILSGTEHHYGWVELSLHPSATPTSGEPWYDLTVYDWAYDTRANQPLTIPEPPSASVIGLLALGMVLRRRI